MDIKIPGILDDDDMFSPPINANDAVEYAPLTEKQKKKLFFYADSDDCISIDECDGCIHLEKLVDNLNNQLIGQDKELIQKDKQIVIFYSEILIDNSKLIIL